MRDFYYPGDEAAFMTARQVELATHDDDPGDQPYLPMVSPEELIHCMVLSFANAIRFLGCVIECPGVKFAATCKVYPFSRRGRQPEGRNYQFHPNPLLTLFLLS
jgi:hypothetical protein